MEEEPRMELLKVLWFGAEIQYGRGSGEKPCLEEWWKVWDFGNVKEMKPMVVGVEHV